MTDDLTPEAVKAAQDMADLLDAWGEVNLSQGRDGQSKDMTKAADAIRALATAYLAMAEENERLRGDVQTMAHALHECQSGRPLSAAMHLCVAEVLARATEGQT